MIQRLFSLFCAVVLALGLAAPALAKDRIVNLTLDGRPLASNGVVVAVAHGGVVFADMIALNKTFNGLMSISGKTYRTVVRGHAVAFTAGNRQAVFQGRKVLLPAAPYLANQSLFVPLTSFGRGIGTQVHVNLADATADIISPN